MCDDFKRHVIDLVEQRLSARDRKKLDEHRAHCASCQQEYHTLQRLYELLDTDEVVHPENEFFDHVRRRVRERELPVRGRIVRKIALALAPAALVIAFVLLLSKPEKTVEISVPTAVLLEDRDVAQLSLDGIVSDQLLDELSTVEDELSTGLDEMLDELNEQEKEQFIDTLVALYGDGT
jgi:predicted anti-sigma-YlaC factor YlaD